MALWRHVAVFHFVSFHGRLHLCDVVDFHLMAAVGCWTKSIDRCSVFFLQGHVGIKEMPSNTTRSWRPLPRIIKTPVLPLVIPVWPDDGIFHIHNYCELLVFPYELFGSVSSICIRTMTVFGAKLNGHETHDRVFWPIKRLYTSRRNIFRRIVAGTRRHTELGAPLKMLYHPPSIP